MDSVLFEYTFFYLPTCLLALLHQLDLLFKPQVHSPHGRVLGQVTEVTKANGRKGNKLGRQNCC